VKIKYTTIFLGLVLSTSIVAQDITNERTKKHVYVPGTHEWMVVPEGFELSTTFPGLQKGEHIFIQLYDINSGYNEAPELTKEYEKDGAIIYDHSTLQFDGYPAQYLYLQNQPRMRSCILMFGDSTFSCMIMAGFPSDDESVLPTIRKAMESVYYDKTAKTDPLAYEPFSLDDAESVFKYAKTTDGRLLYSVGGRTRSSRPNEPVIIFSVINGDYKAPGLAIALKENLHKSGFKLEEEKNIVDTTVNGAVAHQSELYGLLNGKQEMIYQLVIIGREKALVVQGFAMNRTEEYLKAFKQLALTAKWKKQNK